MTKTFSTLIALILITASYTTVEAQQSDYEIQQEFRAEYHQITEWIDNAVSSEDLDEVSDRIDALEAEYGEHTDIINSAIYPDTYSSRLNDLRSRFSAAQQNVATIEELNERVEELEEELEEFRQQLATMDERAEDLQREIRDSQANERRLSGLVQQYRENLEERDQFVAGFLDDLLRRYETVDSETAAELREAAEQLDESPVDLIKTILGEYVNYANQATDLAAEDYLAMKAQHVYFSEFWDSMGERLTEIFDADAPVQSRQEVDDLLSNWNSAIDNRIWGAINDSFAQNNIDLDNFSSADAFYNALQSYVSSATERSEEQNREEDLEEYRNFSQYWNNTVKANWGETLFTGNILTYEQVSDIDQQLGGWNVAAVPTSNLMLILFIVALAVIIGLVIALVRKGKE